MRALILTSLISLTIISCGPNEEEIKKREQFIADSTAAVIAEEARQEELERIHAEKIEVGKSVERTKLTNYLKQLETTINNAENQLSLINEFQIGRSSTTKRQQLDEQQDIINELESIKESIEKEISMTYLHQNHDIQKTPKGTVEHLIESAKKRDFLDVRDLVDPYGEFDDEVFTLCLVAMYPDKEQENWAKEFENGRIMNEKVNEDTAEIEFAHGTASDKLETIKLVNRHGYWYLKSF